MNLPELSGNSKTKQKIWYMGILIFPVLVITASLLFPVIAGKQSNWFGINQIASINSRAMMQILAMAGSFILGCIMLLRKDHWRIAGVILILLIMFVFKSNTMNPDGKDLLWKIPAGVDRVGAHVVHDDWNLYAIVAIPGSILAWSLLVQKAECKVQRYLLITMLAFSMLNTFSWLVKNHAG